MAFSFLKRRIGFQRGKALPLADQYDFLLGALLLTALTSFVWMTVTFTGLIILMVLIMTPVLHISTNVVGYWLGIKNEPW